MTQTMPSATRIYFESQHDLPRPASMTPFTAGGKPAPMGFALFPEIARELRLPHTAGRTAASGNLPFEMALPAFFTRAGF